MRTLPTQKAELMVYATEVRQRLFLGLRIEEWKFASVALHGPLQHDEEGSRYTLPQSS